MGRLLSFARNNWGQSKELLLNWTSSSDRLLPVEIKVVGLIERLLLKDPDISNLRKAGHLLSALTSLIGPLWVTSRHITSDFSTG